MITLPLGDGLHALVDDADAALVEGRDWWAIKRGARDYAVTVINNRIVYLHRHLFGLAPGDPRQVDHRHGNTLDNRRSLSLILLTKARSSSRAAQAAKQTGRGTSAFPGVSRETRARKWKAQIRDGRAGKFLGYYDVEEAAAVAYLNARERLNRPPPDLSADLLLRLAPYGYSL